MLIYRYERDGRGPFTSQKNTDREEELGSELWKTTLSNNTHPEPDWDNYPEDRYDYYFGCESVDILNHWFNETIRELLTLCGFEIVVYDCPDEYCIIDQYQIGFLKDKASVLELVND